MSATSTPTPYHRGALMQALEARRLARARDPRVRAARLGGLITAHLYPASRRPRDTRGRFTQATPAGPGAGQAVAKPHEGGAARRGENTQRRAPAAHTQRRP